MEKHIRKSEGSNGPALDASTTIILLNDSDRAVLHTLLYFDIFSHPLTAQEVFQYTRNPHTSLQQVKTSLKKLAQQGIIYECDNFFLLQDQPVSVEKRKQGNAMALKFLTKARHISGWIARVPYVRGVMISGSLSKGYMDKGSDIDFFIITEKGRLWLCRSMLAAIRKMLPAPWKKYFCINYFIDVSSLSIPDKNLFTATELSFIYPTYNPEIYKAINSCNPWIREYYPNKKNHYPDIISRKEPSGIKAFAEWLLNGHLGEKLDTVLFKIMLSRWQKRYAGFDPDQFDLNIRTRKNVSKQHEKGHQFVILDKYQANVRSFEEKHKVSLSND